MRTPTNKKKLHEDDYGFQALLTYEFSSCRWYAPYIKDASNYLVPCES